MGDGEERITPEAVEPLMKWWKIIATFLGGLSVILGTVVAAVNYLVDERLEDFGMALEDSLVEIAQTVVDDDIAWQDREIELLEERIERLETE